jgi:hypothetical protein
MALPDKSTFDTIGGEIIDFSAVEDPNTDLAGAFNSEARADVAAMTRMIPRAFVAFVVTGTCPVVEHDAVWGNSLAVAPTVAYVSVGLYTVTWPTTVTDARGIIHSLNLRRGMANVDSPGLFASVKRVAANVFSIQAYDAQGPSAGDPASPTEPVTLIVW